MPEIEKELVPSKHYSIQYADGSSITKRGLKLADKLASELDIDKSTRPVKKTGIITTVIEYFSLFMNFQKLKIWGIREGRRLLFGDQWNDATRQQEWRKLIAMEPDNAEAYYRLGNACFEQGKYKTARTYYTVALDKKPDLVDALRRRGDSYFAQIGLIEGILNYNKLKQLAKQALSDYELAFSLDKEVYAVSMMGLMQECLEKWDKAITCYTQAIEIDPNFPDSYYARARVLIEVKERQKALLDLEKYLSFDKWHDNDEVHREEVQRATVRMTMLQDELNDRNIVSKD